MKLFTIGDSVSQGFMSAAAARTDLTYSTLVARSMGLEIGTEYRYPEWAKDGLPLNLERAFRRLEERYGFNIRGAEWLTVLQTLNNVVDEAEDYYERGPGAADEAYVDPARGAMGQGEGGRVFPQRRRYGLRRGRLVASNPQQVPGGNSQRAGGRRIVLPPQCRLLPHRLEGA